MKISGNLFSECTDYRSYHTFSDSGVAFRTAMELVAIKRIRRRSRIFFQNNAAIPLLIIGLSVHIPLWYTSNHPAGCIQLIFGILLVHSILLCAKDTQVLRLIPLSCQRSQTATLFACATALIVSDSFSIVWPVPVGYSSYPSASTYGYLPAQCGVATST